MHLARKGVRVFAANWLTLPLQMITGVIVTRTIGAEGKGIVVILTSSVALLAMLGQFGLPAAGVYFSRTRTHSDRSLLGHYLLVVAAVSLATALLATAATDIFLRLFLQNTDVGLSLVGLALAGLPSLMVLAFVAALFLAQGRTQAYAALTVGWNLLSIVLTFVLLFIAELGATGVVLAGLLAQSIAATGAISYVVQRTRGEPWQLSWSTLRQLMQFGLKHYAGTVGSQLFKRADNFLLAYFLNTEAVGYYSVAVMAYETLLTIPRALTSLVAGEAAAGGADKAAPMVAQVARNVLWIMLAATSGIMLVAPWLVPLLYGRGFSQSVPPLLVLLLAAVLVGFAANLQAFFLGIGRPGLNGSFTLIAGLSNLAFSVWLIPQAGIVGNAVATLLGSGVTVALHLFWFCRLARVSMRDTIIPSGGDVVLVRTRFQHGLRKIVHRV